VFPACPEVGVVVGNDRLCRRCGRPLGGARFGPGPDYRVEAFLGSGCDADVLRTPD